MINVTDKVLTTAEKGKALETALGAIEKQFGRGAIMRMDASAPKQVGEVVSTGSLSLDIALGTGGLTKGRIVEIFGPESSGKTTMTLHAIAQAQKTGGQCAFIDAEHALDTHYAKKIGVNLDTLLVSQPDTGEQALDIVEMLVRSNAVDVVVVDSVAALTPKVELEGEMGDKHIGLQARLMSQALRKLTGIISRSNCVVIFINQLRTKIGVMFGSPETTTGGNALKFYSSVRLDIRRIASVKIGEDTVGNRVRVKVAKNKLAAPFKQAEFDIMFNQGISLTGDILDLGVAKDIVKKAGSWFSYGEERLGQGREGAKAFLEENKDVCEKIKAEIMVAYNLPLEEVLVADDEAEKKAKAARKPKLN
jgi:recombination protein RecA